MTIVSLVIETDSFRLADASIAYEDLAQWIAQTFRLLRTLLPN